MVMKDKNDRPLFVLYDINPDRLRKKIFTACEDFGLAPVQFSVFFGFLNAGKQQELHDRIRLIMKDEEEGNFIMIPLETGQLKKIRSHGKALLYTQVPMVKFL